MRVACLIAVALLAGCLEPSERDDGASADPTMQPTAPDLTAMPSATTPTGTPIATPTPVGSPSGPHAVAFRRIESGQQGGHQEKEVGYVTDAAAWSQFWSVHSSEPQPAVDFARETVAYAVAGQKGSSCWAVRFTNVTDDGAGLTTARYTVYAPPASAMCADVITYPYDIIAIEGAGRTLGFSEQKENFPPDGA